jgi:pyruvate formate lyase activating enzyme
MSIIRLHRGEAAMSDERRSAGLSYQDQRYTSDAFGPGTVPTRWQHRLPDGRIQCDVCPRACRLHDGQRGLCFVRGRDGDGVVSTTYGRSSGFCIDPIEKKPLNHFLPGSPVLSFGTAGCNLTCRYCQNWDISKSRDIDTLADAALPADLAAAAVRLGCRSVAFTYNDPVVFLEYAADTARACRAAGVRTVAVTAGYVEPGPRQELFADIDAANVDLKGFTEDYYHRVCGGSLAPVLDTIAWLVHETDVWVELTTLVVPGLNDSDDELAALARWVVAELGPDVPMHFSAFHPDFKMRDIPRTPAESLHRARRIALGAGVRYAYTGNVVDVDGGTTSCPGCGRNVIVRDWYRMLAYELDDDGTCRFCGTSVAGRFDGQAGTWGRQRQPVHPADVHPAAVHVATGDRAPAGGRE